MKRKIEFLLLGTGACDYDWDHYGEKPEIRGSTSTLLDGEILIDCGPTVIQAIDRMNVDVQKMKALVVTHGHDDHFYGDSVRELLRRNPAVRLYASEQAATLFPASTVLKSGDTFQEGAYTFTALPANHLWEHAPEPAFHFLIQGYGRTALYALDGASLLWPAWKILRTHKLDLLITDCTMLRSGDYRIFEHSDLEMVQHLMKTLIQQKVCRKNTPVVLDHLARTLWPRTQSARLKAVRHTGYIPAEDGMTITLNRKRV